MNRYNQSINFSQQELQFLNNFSSINDLYAFSTAMNNVVEKVDKLQRVEPDLFYSLTGGLSGAGLGAIGGLMVGDKKKSRLRRMLEGGLIGGGLGAGIGALGSAYLKHKREQAADAAMRKHYLQIPPFFPEEHEQYQGTFADKVAAAANAAAAKENGQVVAVVPIKK